MRNKEQGSYQSAIQFTLQTNSCLVLYSVLSSYLRTLPRIFSWIFSNHPDIFTQSSLLTCVYLQTNSGILATGISANIFLQYVIITSARAWLYPSIYMHKHSGVFIFFEYFGYQNQIKIALIYCNQVSRHKKKKNVACIPALLHFDIQAIRHFGISEISLPNSCIIDSTLLMERFKEEEEKYRHTKAQDRDWPFGGFMF